MIFGIYFLITFVIKENWTHLAQKNSQPGAKISTIFRLSWKCLNRIAIKTFQNIWSALSIKFMLCYLKFRFKQQLCGEDHYTTSSFLFFLKEARPKKQPKNLNFNYLIIVPIKMRLLLFLVISQYGLPCKYGIVFQFST